LTTKGRAASNPPRIEFAKVERDTGKRVNCVLRPLAKIGGVYRGPGRGWRGAAKVSVPSDINPVTSAEGRGKRVTHFRIVIANVQDRAMSQEPKVTSGERLAPIGSQRKLPSGGELEGQAGGNQRRIKSLYWRRAGERMLGRRTERQGRHQCGNPWGKMKGVEGMKVDSRHQG